MSTFLYIVIWAVKLLYAFLAVWYGFQTFKDPTGQHIAYLAIYVVITVFIWGFLDKQKPQREKGTKQK